MNRDEWLQAKAKAISSTESPALFHMSPYLTEFELAVQKQKGEVPEGEGSNRTVWGQRLQDPIAQGIADDFKVVIEGTEYEFLTHRSEPRMGSSFDYLITSVREDSILYSLWQQHGPGLLEIKNVDALVYKNWPDVDLPDHIEIQVQHQLEVKQWEWAVVGVLVGGNRIEIYSRMRDGVVGAAITSRITQFWKNLDAGIMPEPIMPEDADMVIKLHQYAEPNKVLDAQSDETLADLCGQYQVHAFTEKQAATAKNSVKARIMTHIGDAEVALVNGYRVSASMVAEAHVPAYTRSPYRYFKVSKREGK